MNIPRFRAYVNKKTGLSCWFENGELVKKEIWNRFMEYDFREIIFENSGDSVIGKRGIWFNFDDAVFMLSVGIKDKSGKEIYENDIVRTKYGRKCLVRYRKLHEQCGFDLIPIEAENKGPDEYDLWKSENLEVVGNIFEDEEYAYLRERV